NFALPKRSKMTETKKNSKKKPMVKSFLGGTILTDERFTRQLPFLSLLVFFAFVLITNRNLAERTIRQIEQVQESINELRSESITLSARLMDASRPSEVVERVEDAGLGLEEPVKPAQKVVVKKNKRRWRSESQ